MRRLRSATLFPYTTLFRSSCLGPVTQAGCGALCPSFDRGCYGCFGPTETPNTASLTDRLRVLGQADDQTMRSFRSEEHTSELQSHVNLVCRLLLGRQNLSG